LVMIVEATSQRLVLRALLCFCAGGERMKKGGDLLIPLTLALSHPGEGICGEESC
jgi:hypothetical protein